MATIFGTQRARTAAGLSLSGLGPENVPGDVDLLHALLAHLPIGRIAREIRVPGLAQTIDDLLDRGQVRVGGDAHAEHPQGVQARARHVLVPNRARGGRRAPDRRALARRQGRDLTRRCRATIACRRAGWTPSTGTAWRRAPTSTAGA